MKRAVVTGAGGFIGSHLTAALAARGHEVVATDLACKAIGHLAADERVTIVEGDITDPRLRENCLRGADTVFHLAAAHLSVATGPAEYERINVAGVAGLIDDVLRLGIERLVHTSSVGVYGRLRQIPADETSPCAPELVYEQTKLRGENEVLAACRERGLSALILRPVWVYGPGCSRTERLFRAVTRGRFLVAGRGGARRHSIQIEDMVRAYLLAASSDASGEVVIAGETTAPTVRELVDAIAEVTGSRPPRSVPFALLRTAATAAELLFAPTGKEPPLSRRTLRLFTANTSFDVSKATRLLGFEASHDIRSGLRASHALITSRAPWRVLPSDYAELAVASSVPE